MLVIAFQLANAKTLMSNIANFWYSHILLLKGLPG